MGCLIGCARQAFEKSKIKHQKQKFARAALHGVLTLLLVWQYTPKASWGICLVNTQDHIAS
jgi:hypothetical protein